MCISGEEKVLGYLLPVVKAVDCWQNFDGICGWWKIRFHTCTPTTSLSCRRGTFSIALIYNEWAYHRWMSRKRERSPPRHLRCVHYYYERQSFPFPHQLFASNDDPDREQSSKMSSQSFILWKLCSYTCSSASRLDYTYGRGSMQYPYNTSQSTFSYIMKVYLPPGNTQTTCGQLIMRTLFYSSQTINICITSTFRLLSLVSTSHLYPTALEHSHFILYSLSFVYGFNFQDHQASFPSKTCQPQ